MLGEHLLKQRAKRSKLTVMMTSLGKSLQLWRQKRRKQVTSHTHSAQLDSEFIETLVFILKKTKKMEDSLVDLAEPRIRRFLSTLLKFRGSKHSPRVRALTIL